MIPLTQFAFNATVKSNLEDFEIPLKEAIEMTVEEYKAQRYDLSKINTTLDFVQFDCKEAEGVARQIKENSEFKRVVDVVDNYFSQPTKLLYASIFIKENIIQYLYSLLDKNASEESLSTYLSLIAVCMRADNFSSSELVYVYPIVLKGLSSEVTEFAYRSLESLLVILSMDTEKDICFSFHIDQLLVAILQSTDKRGLHNSAAKCILSYLQEGKSSDHSKQNRMERVNAFASIDSIYSVLVNIIKDSENEVDCKSLTMRILAVITREETTCKTLDEMDILQNCEGMLMNHADVPMAVIDTFKLLTSLGRSDLLKKRVFSIVSNMLQPICSQYESNRNVMKSLIELLGVVALRNPEGCQSLIEDYQFDLFCFHQMKQVADDHKFILHACLLLRTLISSCHDNEEKLIDAGLMEYLLSIKSLDSAVSIAVTQLRRSIQSVPFTPFNVSLKNK